MDENFIEAILLWNEASDSQAILEWLHHKDLNAIPMRSGLLITGTRADFEAAFGIDLAEIRLPFSLPLPEIMRQHVASVQIPELRQIHKRKR
jgi:hypothetical protein